MRLLACVIACVAVRLLGWLVMVGRLCCCVVCLFAWLCVCLFGMVVCVLVGWSVRWLVVLLFCWLSLCVVCLCVCVAVRLCV